MGVPGKLLSGKHGPCPWCGGKDRFRFSDFKDRGWWVCNQCGKGDGFDFAQRYFSMSFREVAQQVEKLLGVGLPPPTTKPKASGAKAEMIWAKSMVINKDCPAASYLKGRGLRTGSRQIRFNERVWDAGSKKWWPTMVCPITGPERNLVGIHLTFLTEQRGQWVKAPIDTPKKTRRIDETISGGSIRLHGALSGVVALAEGIETALAVYGQFGTPCWAVISTSGMVRWEPPKGIRRVKIYGDNDRNFAGHKAAYDLANRLVIKHKLGVEVHFPDKPGDWLDELWR